MSGPTAQFMVARAVLLVGCYAPPYADAIWRRALGTASGIALVVLSVAWGRGWPKRESTLEEARDEGWMAAAGVAIGTICAVAWAIGLVDR